MQLLVSVRSAAEAEAALAGGAHIIDAKEPAHGSLGAVSPRQLEAIVAAVPGHRPFSVALGDLATVSEILHAVLSLPVPPRPGPVFVKCGFAGIRSRTAISGLLASAVAAASDHPAQPRVVGVAYADAERCGSLPPGDMAELAGESACAGVLLDTHLKAGRGLLRCLTPELLAQWIESARACGLLAAVAGQIGPADLPVLSTVSPDILGVRGAACEGGREGRVAAHLVRALRSSLERLSASGVI